MSETPSLSLPVIAPAQAQKHVTHNDALMMLDALVQLSVISRSLIAPPATPGEGDRYLVPAAATGDWAGHDHSIAAWHDGAWRFFPPQEGWRCVVVEEGSDIRFLHGRWRQGHAITSFGSALVFDAIAETHVLDAAGEEFGQQEMPAAFEPARPHDGRSRQNRRLQSGNALPFALPVPRVGASDKQLHEHRRVAPVRFTNDPLSRQHAQQPGHADRFAIVGLHPERHGEALLCMAQSLRVDALHIPLNRHSRPSKNFTIRRTRFLSPAVSRACCA